ncbi:hypothetical protein [Cellulomonas triticagri]|uniref:histidine kinase n=1 Tax=Cellulomonas triticagri TaxID=2483352 RepID=A0A3M2JRP0_9CELL|nr:hypothetical protein [Cellulomonas triticagri]RMI14343.1 hypothetical protein EBM89_00875 [Cellulomonas triticagri]
MTPRGSPEQERGRVVVVVALVNAVLFGGIQFAQWFGWGGTVVLAARGLSADQVAAGTLLVLVVDLGCVIGTVLVAVAARVGTLSWGRRCGVVLAVAAVAAGVRAAVLGRLAARVGALDDIVDWAATAVGYGVVVTSALLFADLVAAEAAQSRARLDEELRAARLADEEIVHRRVVADRLHGRVQNRLVMLAAELDAVAADLAVEDPGRAARLRRAAERVDDISEQDVRALSHELFPVAVDVSVVRAVLALLDRLPTSTTGALELGAGYQQGTDPQVHDPFAVRDRLVVIDTIEEGVTNAVKHGRARHIAVRLDLVRGAAGTRLEGEVRDDGRGLRGRGLGLRGLERHRARLEARGGTLRLRDDPGGSGSVLRFTLPVSGSPKPARLVTRGGEPRASVP